MLSNSFDSSYLCLTLREKIAVLGLYLEVLLHHSKPVSKRDILEATHKRNPNFETSGWVEASNFINNGMVTAPQEKERLYSLTSEGIAVIQRDHVVSKAKPSENLVQSVNPINLTYNRPYDVFDFNKPIIPIELNYDIVTRRRTFGDKYVGLSLTISLTSQSKTL
ncbi:hypothetical protein GEMRC1_009655 [Eukaryota sp. GEM-RC1]